MRNMMGMGMHKIVGQMGKINTSYQWKIIIPEKWLFMMQNENIVDLQCNNTLFRCKYNIM